MTDNGFSIYLRRQFVTYEGEPYEVWIASANAPAYDDMYGQTPGEALRAMGREYDDLFADEGRGKWEPELDVMEVLSDGKVMR